MRKGKIKGKIGLLINSLYMKGYEETSYRRIINIHYNYI